MNQNVKERQTFNETGTTVTQRGRAIMKIRIRTQLQGVLCFSQHILTQSSSDAK